MDFASLNAVPFAASKSGATPGSGGSFLITPDLGLMAWTLIVFAVSLFILWKLAFPQIRAALDRRQEMINGAIDAAEEARKEADQLLADYRERLREARIQAEEIIERARKAGEAHERESTEAARARREELLEQARRDIEAETQRALAEIRQQVADLTVLATEKVARKTLTAEDQERLVADAVRELDFSALAGTGSGTGNGGAARA